MAGMKDKNDKPNEKNTGQNKNTPGEIVKNPEPRANENLMDKQKLISPSQGTGNEVTDGEAG